MAISRPIGLLLVLLASIGVARADRVRLIETEGEAAQIRVDLVGQAREQIDIAYFIYGEDEAGLIGFHVLREAAGEVARFDCWWTGSGTRWRAR